MIRTLLVDDENLICQTLQLYLESEQNIEIIGTAKNGKKAIAFVKELEPDVILIDIEMPEMDGLTAAELLSQRFPQTKIIILSSHDDKQYLDRALKAGAKGYLLKNVSPEQLSQSIQLVHQGYLQLAPGLSNQLSLSLKQNRDDSYLAIEQGTSLDTAITTIKTKSDFPVIGYSYNALPSETNSLPLIEAEEFLPPISRWTSRGAIILLGIFGTALFLTNVLEYKTTVKAEAKVRPSGELRLVQSAIEGTVTEIKVKSNQLVNRGDIIATIDTDVWQIQKKQLVKKLQQNNEQLNQIKAQIRDLDSQITAETRALSKTVAAAEADLALNQQEYQQKIVASQAELEAATAKVELTQEELTRYQQLSKSGAVSRLQISERQAALKEALARQKQAEAAISPSKANITKAQEQIARQQAQGEALVNNLQRERKVLLEKQISLNKENNSDRAELQQIQNNANKTIIRASASGTIQQLDLRNAGQVISPGDNIATIASQDSELRVMAAVTPQDIGKITIGQTVQVKISACPYPDYGILRGTVQTISPDAFEPESSTNNKSFYKVGIQTDNNFVGTQQDKCLLRSGMNGSADIVTQKETVLRFMLRKARLKVGI